MKLSSRFLNVVTSALILLSGYKISANETEIINLESLWSCENAHVVNSNQNDEILFYKYEDSGYYFFKIGESEAPINIKRNISNKLFELGYHPKSFKIDGECTPWKCDFIVEYEIGIDSKYMDNAGNIIVSFTHEGCKKSIEHRYHDEVNWLRKLGVWNKKYGFKVIEVPEIESVIDVKYSKTQDYLFIYSYDASGKEKMSIVSIKDGFWGEK